MKNLRQSGIKWGLLGAALLTTGVYAQQARITATTPGSGQAVVLDLGGFQVTDASNQKVGKVEHLVISPSGCVDAAVLSMEGNRLVPVPWQLVTVEKSQRVIGGATSVLHVNVDRAKLQAAPAVTREQLVTVSQNTQIFQHFGVQAPSGVGASGSATIQQQGTTTSPSTTPDSSSKGTTPQGSTSSGSSTIQGSSTTSGSLTNAGSSTTPGSQGSTSPGSSTTSGSSTNKASGSDFQQPGQSGTQPPANRPPQNRPPENRPPENRPPSSTPSTP
jgi:hypothetical protein